MVTLVAWRIYLPSSLAVVPEDFNQQQVGGTFGGPVKRDEVFFFTSVDFQRRRSTKQLDPNRIEPRVVDALAALGSPNENGPIDRTQDARVFLGKVDWQANADNRLSVRYAYTWSEHENGTFECQNILFAAGASLHAKPASYLTGSHNHPEA